MTTLQGLRISKSVRLNRIREMVVSGTPYSTIAFFVGIPENRIPRIVAEIRRIDKAALPDRLARRDELRSKAETSHLDKWERLHLKELEKPETLELPDKRKADAGRKRQWAVTNEKCKGCGRDRRIGENCRWHDCVYQNEFPT